LNKWDDAGEAEAGKSSGKKSDMIRSAKPFWDIYNFDWSDDLVIVMPIYEVALS
jgi:hypothetical protein